MKTDECISDVGPVAHPSSFISFLFLSLASHLLRCVGLNELSVSQPGPSPPPQPQLLRHHRLNVPDGGLKRLFCAIGSL